MEPAEIRLLADDEKGPCEAILRTLPKWFGIEESIRRYVTDISALPTLGALADGELLGFVALKRHFEHAAEVLVMAVRPGLHRQGIGRALLAAAEPWLREQGVRWLQVKTLAPSAGYEPYERTRAFYLAQGFEPLEEFPSLWSEGNPCLLLVKRL